MMPLDVAVELGESVTLHAATVSDADTRVTYTWYHGDRKLVGDNVTIHLHPAAGNLTILDTDQSDLGLYRCVASNGISTVSATATLYLPPAAPPAAGSLTHLLIVTFRVQLPVYGV